MVGRGRLTSRAHANAPVGVKHHRDRCLGHGSSPQVFLKSEQRNLILDFKEYLYTKKNTFQLQHAVQNLRRTHRRGASVMSSTFELRTYLEDIPVEALLNMVSHSVRSSGSSIVDDNGVLDVIPIPLCLVHLAHSSHPLHNASVELLRKLAWKERELFPSEATQAFFTVFCPRCLSLTLHSRIKYRRDCFVRVLTFLCAN